MPDEDPQWQAPTHVGADGGAATPAGAERATPKRANGKRATGRGLQSAKASDRETLTLGWMVLATAALGLGIILVMYFVSQAFTEGSGVSLIGALGCLLGVGCVAAALFAGQRGERLGSRALIALAAVLVPLTCVVTILLANPYLVR